ncbi:MAG: alpha/beta hydrolase [Burkholderiales bacterium]|nr:alpha/beta hydrolase [Burkholderiales bacterium]
MTQAVIDPHQKIILDRMRALPAVDMRALPLAVARQTFEDNQRPWVHCPVPTGPTTELSVPGPAGPIRARLYRPAGDPAARVPLVVFAHGGGWTFGSIDTHEGTARTIAGFSGCAVLSIDYRLAPEHPFPAPLDDVLAAVAFARGGGLGEGIDAGRMALAGDSAGANLALGAMLALRDRGLPMPLTATLFYGCFAPIFDTRSNRRFGDGSFLLGTANMRWYWANFLGNDDFAAAPPHAAPLTADLAGLPPLYLNAAGLDPLLDDTLLTSARLAEAGVRHRLDVWPGVVHGFLRLARELPTAVAALAAAGDHLRSALNQKT